MPGILPCDSNGLSRDTPPKKSRLSLKFFQKRETKRALNFTESQENEEKPSENVCSEIDQVIPATQLLSPVHCEKKVNMLPFVGLNNLGNTCYLNSILQVLYFCPGFKTGVKLLSNIISQKKENLKEEIGKGIIKEDSLASYELVLSLHSLIVSVDQLQASFLLNPDRYTDELATPPRRLLNTLRELNPMYEGYLQHDAQEVLQCILGHIDKTCQRLKEELKPLPLEESTVQLENRLSKNTVSLVTLEEAGTMLNWQAIEDCEDKSKGSGKRKNDTEDGNEKKKSKVSKEKNEVENRRETRSKRFSKRKTLEEKPENQAEVTIKYPMENESTKPTPKKSRLKLNWLKSSSNQPSILSKFCSLGKLSTNLGFRDQIKEIETCEVKVSLKNKNGDQTEEKYCDSWSPVESTSEKETGKPHKTDTELAIFNLVEKLFQGQLVLRTRCLECECFTERREDFQDISVPVQKDELSKVDENFEISPEPKTEVKTLKWAISQFASVERIVGEDKYFCENCRHYTEAERSLLFDKMPEVITIHLKCFAAAGLEFDCYGGLSKINTPLLTPLELSLDDWSIKPANEIYGLFAVVMHSGITISSGHYTASVKITNLSSLELDKENFITDPQCEMTHSEPLKKQEARTVTEDYDDGEVSFKVNGNTQPNKGLNKKNIEAVGLLGGQKSKPTCDLVSSKATHSGMIVTETRNAEWNHANGIVEVEHHDQPCMVSNGPESKSAHIMQSLKEYEGKWLLFDDSEVKVTEEKDFLNSLSPVSSSTSTPYLLFYKKIVE